MTQITAWSSWNTIPLTDELSKNVFQRADLLSEELQRALASLDPRERSVITLRFGIGDGRNRTLIEVAKELGISRERVRQLETRALKKMRSHFDGMRVVPLS